MDIRNTNFPLGVLEGAPFIGESIGDIRGRQLIIYTDGLTEAENPQHELFGENHLTEIISGRQDDASNDDLTLLCLKVLKS